MNNPKVRYGASMPKDAGCAKDAEPDPQSVARTIALRLLNATPRTKHNLFEALVSRGVPDDVATEVVTRYEEVGLLDDRAYARSLARSRLTSQGRSRGVIARELRTKGVEADVIDDVISEINPDDELEAARRIVEKRMRQTVGLDDRTRYRRIAGALGRRGFGTEIVRRVLDDAFAQENL